MADTYATLDETAAVLRVSRETARKAVLDGRIEGFQVNGPGSLWRIPRRGLRNLNKSRGNGVATIGDSGDNPAGNNDGLFTKTA